jgi:hypothetical protein
MKNHPTKIVLYECSFCHNTWTLAEGFRLDTNQCAGCQKWDDDKPKRDKEHQERKKWLDANFKYVAGDPFW